MQGLGNDFVILDRRSGKLSLSPLQIRAHRRPAARRRLRPAAVPRALAAGRRLHAGLQRRRLRGRRLRQRHPRGRAPADGGAGRQPARRSRPRPGVLNVTAGVIGLQRRHGPSALRLARDPAARDRWTRCISTSARGPLSDPVARQHRQSACGVLRARCRGVSVAEARSRAGGRSAVSASAPTSASPQVHAPATGSGCACGSAVPGSPRPAARARAQRWSQPCGAISPSARPRSMLDGGTLGIEWNDNRAGADDRAGGRDSFTRTTRPGGCSAVTTVSELRAWRRSITFGCRLNAARVRGHRGHATARWAGRMR